MKAAINILNSIDDVEVVSPFQVNSLEVLGKDAKKMSGCRCRKLPAFHGSKSKLIRCRYSRFILTKLLHINCNVTAYFTFMYFGLMNACITFFAQECFYDCFFYQMYSCYFVGIMTGWMNSCFSVEISFLIASMVIVFMIVFCLHRYDGRH